MLDVDGTILDMAITPGSVVVPASLRSSLDELLRKTGGALALVSGRLIRDLDNLFAPLRLPAIGGHGAEMRLSGDLATQARHADAIGEAFRKLVAAVAAADPRIVLEDKRSSLAVHYRLAPQIEQALKTKIAAIVARGAVDDLEVMHGKSVIEIKSTHFSKGLAVRELMEEVRLSCIVDRYSSVTILPTNRCSSCCPRLAASAIRWSGSSRERTVHSARRTRFVAGSHVFAGAKETTGNERLRA